MIGKNLIGKNETIDKGFRIRSRKYTRNVDTGRRSIPRDPRGLDSPGKLCGREELAARDTAYYGFPFFWYRRPIYDDNDDDIVNGGQILEGKRRSSTVSYTHVGAGWGR
ncbi:uncharacterized protein LOC143899143 isoform X1 [Temnothorax americanus]|uniref:uncharacterized protein LOC143899143 isoform X1 n=1 Tax=Temnothorax americanus TaxID=1964332 RepID=UPI0040695D91